MIDALRSSARSKSRRWPGARRISNSACRPNCSSVPNAEQNSEGRTHLGIPLLQKARVGAYVVRQHLAGPQALSARADARAAVPLQPRLRGLRQDRLSGRDPQPAPVGRRRASRRSTNAARRSCRSPAASRCCTRSCRRSSQGIIARKQVRLPLHQRAADGEEDRRSTSRSPYFIWSVHLDGDKRDARQVGVPGRRLRPAVAAIKAGQGAAASASTSTARCSTTPSPSAWRRSSTT